jgi:hypothetical protein
MTNAEIEEAKRAIEEFVKALARAAAKRDFELAKRMAKKGR